MKRAPREVVKGTEDEMKSLKITTLTEEKSIDDSSMDSPESTKLTKTKGAQDDFEDIEIDIPDAM